MTNLYIMDHAILIGLMDYGVLKGLECDYVYIDKSFINDDDL